MNHLTNILDGLSTTELFEVLPTTMMSTAPLTKPDQLHRWESLNGDHRDPCDILRNPALRAGTTYWANDALQALVLRQAARRDGHLAEVLWDLGMEQYAVTVANTMPAAWK